MSTIPRRSFLTLAGTGLVGVPLLAACGTGGGGTGGATTPSTGGIASAVLPDYIPLDAVTPDFPATPAGAIDTFLTYPQPATAISSGTPGDGQPITGLAQLNGAPPAALANNPYWQELNDRLGSPMEIDAVNAGDDFLARVSTIQASGDIPDLIQLNPAVPSLAEFLESSFVDLSNHLGGDKVSAYPALANIQQQFWRAGVYNGRLYGIPNPRGMASARVMYYRKDLMDAQGITVDLASFKDFFDLAKEVTAPASNVWAMTTNPLSFVRQMLGIPNGWYEEGSSYRSALEHEAQEEALAAVVSMREAGVLNPDMGAANPNQLTEWFGTGTGLFTFGSYTGYQAIHGTYSVGVDGFDVDLLQVPDYDSSSTANGWAGNLTNNIISIPRSAEDRIETILGVVNYLASPFGSEEALFLRYGTEGEHFDWVDGNPVARPDVGTQFAIGVGYLGSPPYVFFYPNDPGAGEKIYNHMVTFAETAVIDPTQVLYSPTYASKNASISSAIQATELDIIYGRQPVSAWADAVASYMDGGGRAVADELTAAEEV